MTINTEYPLTSEMVLEAVKKFLTLPNTYVSTYVGEQPVVCESWQQLERVIDNNMVWKSTGRLFINSDVQYNRHRCVFLCEKW